MAVASASRPESTTSTATAEADVTVRPLSRAEIAALRNHALEALEAALASSHVETATRCANGAGC
ncbi:MAG: hypothetical protein GW913_06375 [Myxococcales bacterium]|nr:hypothetical protein [Myxococcales bacterium]